MDEANLTRAHVGSPIGACPGCGYIGGGGITKQDRYWHEHCWIKQIETERDYYRAGLRMIAQHDWQEIGAKGELYTLNALAELIDAARRTIDA